MNLVTTRTIHADKVRALCIRQDYYTCGTVREYRDMLDFVDNENADEFVILTAAEDILKHSDTKALMSEYGFDDEKELLESICYNLINDCTHTSVKIEA